MAIPFGRSHPTFFREWAAPLCEVVFCGEGRVGDVVVVERRYEHL